jgi:prepilin-type N-terminal cleavage/methylation domain-containing protein
MAARTNMRKAFTLLELLVVITIIAILAAVLASKYSQVKENGWSTRCKANLRSLHQSALNYTTDNGGGYPHAGPWEGQGTDSLWYESAKGWVNWIGPVWPHNSSGLMTQPTWYGTSGRDSITNGTLWEYTNHDRGAYFCPKFRSLKQSYDVVRSYGMNGYFGCANQRTNINFGAVAGNEASRTLLFADMQPQQNYLGVNNYHVCSTWISNGGDGDDGVLDPKGNLGTPPIGSPPTQTYETIGFIHNMSGNYYGHAVFLDGHVDAIGLKQADGTWSNRTYDACIGKY